MLIVLFAALAAIAVACGSDKPASGPTQTPTGGTVTPVPTAPVTPTAVPTQTPQSEMQRNLDAARAAWNANKSASYAFDITWLCFCSHGGKTATVAVSHGAITSVKDATTGAPVSLDERDLQMTIDGLFDLIQTGLDTDAGNVIELSFDQELGYPISASIDWLVNAIDDEVAFEVTNFKPGLQAVDAEQLRSDLDAAMALWFDSGYENYQFIFKWQCFCRAGATTPVKIRVEGGQVVSVTDPISGNPVVGPKGLEYRDVLGLFGWISERIELGPGSAEMVYDPETGHPVSVRIDPHLQPVDGEVAFFVEELISLNVHVELQRQLDEARARWAAMALPIYNYRFNWQCFCPEDFVTPVFVTVENDVVIQVVTADFSEPVNPQFRDEFKTVNGLFDLLQSAIDEGAASIRAEFDSVTGLPTEVFIDFQTIMADEELGWNASGVAALE